MTMRKTSHSSERSPRPLPALLRRFAREEDGLVTLFAILMILLMILLGGVGVDLGDAGRRIGDTFSGEIFERIFERIFDLGH